ncbi:MAG: GNAT family N-acetyltransferase [bacterium]
MVRVRPGGPADRALFRRLLDESLGLSGGGEAPSDPVPEGARLWLAWSSEEEGKADEGGGEGAPPVGFCRLVPDREARARGKACMDLLYVAPGARRRGVARALLEAVREAARAEGLEGLMGYFPGSVANRFLRSTGGRRLRDLLLLRCGRLADIPPPSPPPGYRLRASRLPEDLARLGALYNEIFAEMWNFRPHGEAEVSAWFEGPESDPKDCIILEAGEGEEGKDAAEAVGMAVLAVDPLRLAGADPAGYVPDIGVAPGHRKRGLGRTLIAAAAERARARGLAAIELIVDKDDGGARAFYRSLGFEELGEIGVYEW